MIHQLLQLNGPVNAPFNTSAMFQRNGFQRNLKKKDIRVHRVDHSSSDASEDEISQYEPSLDGGQSDDPEDDDLEYEMSVSVGKQSSKANSSACADELTSGDEMPSDYENEIESINKAESLDGENSFYHQA